MDLVKTVQNIVIKSIDLKNKYTDVLKAPVDYACIFCQNDIEYEVFTKEVKELGKIVQDTPTGFTYLLDNPLVTKAGSLRLVKIRKPDPIRLERGDADFNTDYPEFKQKYLNHPNFELVQRDTFEMLRLSDSSGEVMACFSNIPLSEVLGITP